MPSEPHKVSRHTLLHDLWWLIRGVPGKHFRTICARCGRPGNAHYDWRGCWRFKAKKKTIYLRLFA